MHANLSSFIAFSQTATTTTIKINQLRIEQRIFKLTKFGKDCTGKGERLLIQKATNKEDRTLLM